MKPTKSKWNIVKVLLEDYIAKGTNPKKITRMVANNLDMSTQNINYYIRKHNFKFDENTKTKKSTIFKAIKK